MILKIYLKITFFSNLARKNKNGIIFLYHYNKYNFFYVLSQSTAKFCYFYKLSNKTELYIKRERKKK